MGKCWSTYVTECKVNIWRPKKMVGMNEETRTFARMANDHEMRCRKICE